MGTSKNFILKQIRYKYGSIMTRALELSDIAFSPL